MSEGDEQHIGGAKQKFRWEKRPTEESFCSRLREEEWFGGGSPIIRKNFEILRKLMKISNLLKII